jgi:hypothetical protein
MSVTTISTGPGRSTRRQFGRAVAGSIAGVIAVPSIVHGRNLNEKLNIALIGVGGPGCRQSAWGPLRKYRDPVRRL